MKKTLIMGIATLGLAVPLALGSAAPASAAASGDGGIFAAKQVIYGVRVWASAAGWMNGGGAWDTIPWGDIENDAQLYVSEL